MTCIGIRIQNESVQQIRVFKEQQIYIEAYYGIFCINDCLKYVEDHAQPDNLSHLST